MIRRNEKFKIVPQYSKRARRLEVMFEFLIFGIVVGIVEDILAVKLTTGEPITLKIVGIVVLIAIPFAIIGEIVADRVDFIRIGSYIRDKFRGSKGVVNTSSKKRIVKKVLPEYFQDILDGKKKYELRLDDFDVVEGDILILEEYTSADPETRKATGRVLEKEVTYIKKFKLQDLWWTEEELKEKGIQIISFD